MFTDERSNKQAAPAGNAERAWGCVGLWEVFGQQGGGFANIEGAWWGGRQYRCEMGEDVVVTD